MTANCENLLYMYLSLNTIIHLADSHIMRNLEFTAFIALFKRESFIITGTAPYSSATSIPPENMRLITCRSLRKSYTTHYAFKSRIIVNLDHPSWHLQKISFLPIKGNRILLFAEYLEEWETTFKACLYLSIHEICSDNRVGPALWSFNGSVDGRFGINDLVVPIKSTENALGITFGVQFDSQWKLFDISTTETDAEDNCPLIESGRIDYDLKLNSKSKHDSLGLSKFSVQSC
jgi:hypothetical protein